MNYLFVIAALAACLEPSYGGRVFTKDLLKSPSHCDGLTNWSTMPHGNDCAKFYACANGVREEFTCPQYYHFSELEGRCVVGSCGETAETPEAEVEPECYEQRMSRIEGNCTAFEFCHERRKYRGVCAIGSYFDPLLSMCRRVALNVQHKCSCILPPQTVLENENDCKSFYVCDEGRALLRQCPKGHFYSKRTQSCLPDLDGICVPRPEMSAAEIATLAKCKLQGKDGVSFYSHPSECAQFIICLNGHVFTQQCKEGFYFDKTEHFCRIDVAQLCHREENKDEAQDTPTVEQPLEIEALHKPIQHILGDVLASHIKPPVEDASKETVYNLNAEVHVSKEVNHLDKQPDVEKPIEVVPAIHQTPNVQFNMPQTSAPQQTFFEKLASKFLLK